jgi:hypothetical protein
MKPVYGGPCWHHRRAAGREVLDAGFISRASSVSIAIHHATHLPLAFTRLRGESPPSEQLAQSRAA